MSALFGTRTTADWSTNEAPTAFSDRILWYYPDGPAKLTMLLGRMSPKSVESRKFTFFEQDLQIQRSKLTGTHNESVTTINLDTGTSLGSYPGAYFRKGYVIMNETTREVMVVDSNPSSTATSISVVRNVNGATLSAVAYDMVATDYISVIGTAHAENAGVPRIMNENPTEIWNYCQIFRTPLGLSGTAEQEYIRTGKPKANEKWAKGLEHARSQEMAILFGARNSMAVDGDTTRFTGGLTYFVTSNVTDFSSAGGFSVTTLQNALEPMASAPGSSEHKLAFAGSQAMVSLNRMGEENSCIQTLPGGTTYGMRVKQIEHAHGVLDVIRHPLLSANPNYKDAIFIVDPKNIKRRFFNNRDTKYLTKRAPRGTDGMIDEFLGEIGFEIGNEATHGILYGCSAYLP